MARGDFSLESGEKAAAQLLARADRPSAMFCFNDQMAIGAMDVLRRRGLIVPDDVSVVGFDDIPFARYAVPALDKGLDILELLARESDGLTLNEIAPSNSVEPGRTSGDVKLWART